MANISFNDDTWGGPHRVYAEIENALVIQLNFSNFWARTPGAVGNPLDVIRIHPLSSCCRAELIRYAIPHSQRADTSLRGRCTKCPKPQRLYFEGQNILPHDFIANCLEEYFGPFEGQIYADAFEEAVSNFITVLGFKIAHINRDDALYASALLENEKFMELFNEAKSMFEVEL